MSELCPERIDHMRRKVGINRGTAAYCLAHANVAAFYWNKDDKEATRREADNLANEACQYFKSSHATDLARMKLEPINRVIIYLQCMRYQLDPTASISERAIKYIDIAIDRLAGNLCDMLNGKDGLDHVWGYDDIKRKVESNDITLRIDNNTLRFSG